MAASSVHSAHIPIFCRCCSAVNALAEEAGSPSVSALAAQAASQEPAHSQAVADLQGMKLAPGVLLFVCS